MESKLASTTIKIAGMSCGGCVKSITEVLMARSGVAAAQVSLEKGEAQIDFDEQQVSRQELCALVEDAGFDAE